MCRNDRRTEKSGTERSDRTEAGPPAPPLWGFNHQRSTLPSQKGLFLPANRTTTITGGSREPTSVACPCTQVALHLHELVAKRALRV